MDLSTAAASLLGANIPEDVQKITPSSGGIFIETIGKDVQTRVVPSAGDAEAPVKKEGPGPPPLEKTAAGRPLRRTQVTKMQQRAASRAVGFFNEGVSSLLEANSRFKHKRDLVYGVTSTTCAYWAASKLLSEEPLPESVSWSRVVDLFYKRYATVFATANTKAFFDVVNAFSDGVRQEQWCLLMLLDAIICRLTNQIPNDHRSQRRNFNHHEEFAMVLLTSAGLVASPGDLTGQAAERIGQEGQRKRPQVVPAVAPSSTMMAAIQQKTILGKDSDDSMADVPQCIDINEVIINSERGLDNGTTVYTDDVPHATRVIDIVHPWNDITNFKPTNKTHNQRGIRTKVAVYNGVVQAGSDLTNMTTVLNAVVNMVIHNRDAPFLTINNKGKWGYGTAAGKKKASSDGKVVQSGGASTRAQAVLNDDGTPAAPAAATTVDNKATSEADPVNAPSVLSSRSSVSESSSDKSLKGLVPRGGSSSSSSLSSSPPLSSPPKRDLADLLVTQDALGRQKEYLLNDTQAPRKRSRSGIPNDISGVRYDRTKPSVVHRPHPRVKKADQTGKKEPDAVAAQASFSSVNNRLPPGWLMLIDSDAKAPYYLHRETGTLTVRFPSHGAFSNKSAAMNTCKVDYVSQLWSPDTSGPLSVPQPPTVKARASTQALKREEVGPAVTGAETEEGVMSLLSLPLALKKS